MKLGLTTGTAEEQRREINAALYEPSQSPAGIDLNKHTHTHTLTLPSTEIQQAVEVLEALLKCHQLKVALKLSLSKTSWVCFAPQKLIILLGS